MEEIIEDIVFKVALLKENCSYHPTKVSRQSRNK